jgi:hypothetical protein
VLKSSGDSVPPLSLRTYALPHSLTHSPAVSYNMKSLSLAVLITISLLLPIIPATPLPICDPDSIDSSANYLLPKDQLLSCGLPLSRSYLLSQFNAILTVDKIPKETKFHAQSTSSITVSVCRPPESFKELFWHDDVSVISPTPWDIETCKRAELNIYTRLVSEKSFQSAYVRPLNLPDRCGFRVEFTPYYSGDYKLEVVNTWLAASTDPNPESAHPEYGHRWIGIVIFSSVCILSRVLTKF